MHQYLFTCSHIEHGELYRVHWLRYALSEIKTHPSHKRIRSRNRNFQYIIEDLTHVRVDHAELHYRYRSSIDFDGAWSIEDCLFGDDEVERNMFTTKCISVFDDDKLIAAGYFDVGQKAAASILHFFDPGYRSYSLGKYLILITLDYLCAHGYHWYYPGYIVSGLPKFDYKLFLGKEEAQYFDPQSASWKCFQEGILTRQPMDSPQKEGGTP
jgi:arginine-tRNA-protein transferase